MLFVLGRNKSSYNRSTDNKSSCKSSLTTSSYSWISRNNLSRNNTQVTLLTLNQITNTAQQHAKIDKQHAGVTTH